MSAELFSSFSCRQWSVCLQESINQRGLPCGSSGSIFHPHPNFFQHFGVQSDVFHQLVGHLPAGASDFALQQSAFDQSSCHAAGVGAESAVEPPGVNHLVTLDIFQKPLLMWRVCGLGNIVNVGTQRVERARAKTTSGGEHESG